MHLDDSRFCVIASPKANKFDVDGWVLRLARQAVSDLHGVAFCRGNETPRDAIQGVAMLSFAINRRHGDTE